MLTAAAQKGENASVKKARGMTRPISPPFSSSLLLFPFSLLLSLTLSSRFVCLSACAFAPSGRSEFNISFLFWTVSIVFFVELVVWSPASDTPFSLIGACGSFALTSRIGSNSYWHSFALTDTLLEDIKSNLRKAAERYTPSSCLRKVRSRVGSTAPLPPLFSLSKCELTHSGDCRHRLDSEKWMYEDTRLKLPSFWRCKLCGWLARKLVKFHCRNYLYWTCLWKKTCWKKHALFFLSSYVFEKCPAFCFDQPWSMLHAVFPIKYPRNPTTMPVLISALIHKCWR
jgi:hypothetical protein